MQYFWETVESLKAAKIKGVGFKHFDDTHMMWICITLAVCIAGVSLYKSLGTSGRRNMRFAVAALCIADEIYKVVSLSMMGAYTAKYLPLHLCSINIIIIAVHVFKPTQTMDNSSMRSAYRRRYSRSLSRRGRSFRSRTLCTFTALRCTSYCFSTPLCWCSAATSYPTQSICQRRYCSCSYLRQ